MTRWWVSDPDGFTLVELLVTIAIIGVLAGVAVLSLNSSQSSSARQACRTSYQAVLLAVTGYKSDTSTALPIAAAPGISQVESVTALAPYMNMDLLKSNSKYFKLGLQSVPVKVNASGYLVTVTNGANQLIGTSTTTSGVTTPAPDACGNL